MGKRLNVAQLAQKKYTLVAGLSPQIREALGEIEDSFTAIIYGDSGNGKTNLLIQLLKEFKNIGNMLYISYEEGHGKTIKDLIIRHNLHNELPNLRFSDGESIGELQGMLRKKGSPKVIVIDSWQFSGLTIEDYIALKRAFVFGKTNNKRKIFLFISHVNGRHPDGKSALEIKRDANIKIRAEGFMGIVETSRYGSNANIVIWPEGARKYWGKKFKKLSEPKSRIKINGNRPKELPTPGDSAITPPINSPSVNQIQMASENSPVFSQEDHRLLHRPLSGRADRVCEGQKRENVCEGGIFKSAEVPRDEPNNRPPNFIDNQACKAAIPIQVMVGQKGAVKIGSED